MNIDTRRRRHRKFLLDLHPTMGQQYAVILGGYAPPSPDIQEKELEATLKTWHGMEQSGALEHINECSWWMTRAMDLAGRQTRQEAIKHSDTLATFAISTISKLMDEGIIQFAEEPPAPKFVLTSEQSFSDDERIAFSAIEKLLTESVDIQIQEQNEEE